MNNAKTKVTVADKTYTLTARQVSTLRRLYKNSLKDQSYYDALSPDIAKQLIAKKLVERTPTNSTYTRTEWNRPVATLWHVILTPAAKSVACALMLQHQEA